MRCGRCDSADLSYADQPGELRIFCRTCGWITTTEDIE